MPIPKYDPRDPIIPKKNVTEDVIYKEQYRNAVVDSKQTHYNDLFTFLPGSKWKVILYTQIKGGEEEAAPFQRGKDIPLQQYKKIINYELLLQGSLSTAIDENGMEVSTGTCLVYPGLRVNFGDMFIADIGNGRAGLFTINERPVKKSRFKESVFEVSVVLQDYMTAELDRELETYVQERYYFDRNQLKYGSSSIIVESQYHDKTDLEKFGNQFREMYVHEFYNYQYNSFILADPAGAPTYDPFLTRAVTHLIDLMAFPMAHKINRFNASDLGIERVITLWDCLLERKPMLLPCLAMRNFKAIPAHLFSKSIRAQSFAFSGMSQMLGPDGGTFDVHNPGSSGGGGTVPMVPIPSGCCNSCDDGDWANEVISGIKPGGGGQTPDDGTEGTKLPWVHKDAYVLSKAFYDHDDANMTKFERLLWLGLEESTVNASDVMPYYKSYCKWSKTDKLYLGPLLWILTEYALRSFYE